MEKFNEKFPSLKDKRFYVYDYPDGYSLEEDDTGELFKIEDVEKHCLDKQKVREVIDNFQTKKRQITDKILIQEELKENLKKELGL